MSNALIRPWKAVSAMISPERDDVRQGEGRKRERLHRGQRLRPHEEPPAIEPLDPCAGKWTQQERDDLPGELTTPRRSAEWVS